MDPAPDPAEEQRIAEGKAKAKMWQTRMMCMGLAREICTGVSQKAVVKTWMNKLMEGLCLEVQTRKGWSGMSDNLALQVRILEMIEKQGKRLAELESQRKLLERSAKKNKIEEYWRGKRLDIRLDG